MRYQDGFDEIGVGTSFDRIDENEDGLDEAIEYHESQSGLDTGPSGRQSAHNVKEGMRVKRQSGPKKVVSDDVLDDWLKPDTHGQTDDVILEMEGSSEDVERPSQIRCPNCGHIQQSSQICIHCGVIFEKYKRMQAQHWTEQSPQARAAKQHLLNRRRKYTICARVAIVLLLMGAVAVGIGKEYRSIQLFRHFLSKDWPTTEGTIVYSEVRQEIEFRSYLKYTDGDIPPEGVDRNTYYFRPAITYRYSVNGKVYTDTMVSFAQEKGEEYSRKMVEQHPLNSKCAVYYNPKSPSTAVLIPGLPEITTRSILGNIVVGSLLLVAGLAGMAFRRSLFLRLRLGLINELGKEY